MFLIGLWAFLGFPSFQTFSCASRRGEVGWNFVRSWEPQAQIMLFRGRKDHFDLQPLSLEPPLILPSRAFKGECHPGSWWFVRLSWLYHFVKRRAWSCISLVCCTQGSELCIWFSDTFVAPTTLKLRDRTAVKMLILKFKVNNQSCLIVVSSPAFRNLPTPTRNWTGLEKSAPLSFLRWIQWIPLCIVFLPWEGCCLLWTNCLSLQRAVKGEQFIGGVWWGFLSSFLCFPRNWHWELERPWQSLLARVLVQVKWHYNKLHGTARK